MADGSGQMNSLQQFEPSAQTQRAYRDALGHFPTGVTVVTAHAPQGFVGMTVNSFSSVSLDPPMVLWCLANDSNRYAEFAEATHFAIHVLAEGQSELAWAFARSSQAFDALTVNVNEAGVPVFAECLARFECATAQRHAAGDHQIVVGHVTSAAYAAGQPLVFAKGGFGRFDIGA
ncbi:MAG: flavin reductase family protein [Pseudomonadota bacterium]